MAKWDDWPRKTDKNGTPLCRFCSKELEPPRKAWCSDACHTELAIRCDQGFARRMVYRRDKSVCAECGMDTDAIRWQVHPSCAESPEELKVITARAANFMAMGFPSPDQTWWEMDHIKPVVKGGGGCGLDNLQTLCVPCHKRKTAALAKERADARKNARKARQLIPIPA